MVHISKNAEVNQEAWALYAQMQNSPLDAAIAQIGNPNADDSSNSSSTASTTS